MEMINECLNCRCEFELSDGVPSKVYGGIIVCEDCGESERIELQRLEELQSILQSIENAKVEIIQYKDRLKELRYKPNHDKRMISDYL